MQADGAQENETGRGAGGAANDHHEMKSVSSSLSSRIRRQLLGNDVQARRARAASCES